MVVRHQKKDWNLLVIGFSNLDIIWNLNIVIWDFCDLCGKANLFYLNQLELTLTLPSRPSAQLDTVSGLCHIFATCKKFI
jgi:hypothetical protein